jgi:hypothetical protein
MIHRLLIAGLSCILVAGTAAPVQAAKKAPTTENAKAKKAKPTIYGGKVAAVDKTAKTVTLDGKKDLAIHITSETRIDKDGKAATFEDIAVGEVVKIRTKVKDGKTDALAVHIGKPVEKAKEKKKK